MFLFDFMIEHCHPPHVGDVLVHFVHDIYQQDLIVKSDVQNLKYWLWNP